MRAGGSCSTARIERQKRFDAGELPDFPEETRDIREGDWTVGAIPADLLDRRVEITGPTNAKMVINALNSGAKVFMADFEDATAPVWDELVQGQINLRNRWLGKLDFTDPDSGKHYALGAESRRADGPPARLAPDERHVTVERRADRRQRCSISASTSSTMRAPRSTPAPAPISICPSWRAVTRRHCGATSSPIPKSGSASARGTIKATVLIETLPAAFEMDEILHALRDNIVGLNCGRWDYIFSYIKRLGRSPDRLTPDRSAMTMDRAFLAAYSLRLIATCHRRGAFAMGGMSAFIPVKGDEAANAAALDKVRADKLREVDQRPRRHLGRPPGAGAGGDGSVRGDGRAQPAGSKSRTTSRGRDEMLELHHGPRTEAGARENIRVAVQYIAAWLGGRGAVPLYNLMEDAATAEICRAQLWQWLQVRSAVR